MINPYMYLLEGERPAPNVFDLEWGKLVHKVFLWTYATEAVERAERDLAGVATKLNEDMEEYRDELRKDRVKLANLEALCVGYDNQYAREALEKKRREVKKLERIISAPELARRLAFRQRDAADKVAKAKTRLHEVEAMLDSIGGVDQTGSKAA